MWLRNGAYGRSVTRARRCSSTFYSHRRLKHTSKRAPHPKDLSPAYIVDSSPIYLLRGKWRNYAVVLVQSVPTLRMPYISWIIAQVVTRSYLPLVPSRQRNMSPNGSTDRMSLVSLLNPVSRSEFQLAEQRKMSPFVVDSHPGDRVIPNGPSAPSMHEIPQLGVSGQGICSDGRALKPSHV